MKNNLLKLLPLVSPLLFNSAHAMDCQSIADELANQLESRYVLEDTAQQLSQKLRSSTLLQTCNSKTTGESIAAFITAELKSLANDKHLAVFYDPAWVEELKAYRASEQSSAFADSRAMETPTDNYGFKRMEILDGNIGYLDIRMFSDSHLGGETLENAMKFLQHTDGILIDLRNNFGGSPFMVTSLASYFFDGDTVHLSTFESRQNGSLTSIQDWTSPYVPGPRFKDTPVYILTSKNSASAAESFSYAMQSLGRAHIVGEVTAGAAHGRSAEIIGDDFVLTLPTSRPIDPRTQNNWETSGVTPDINVNADDAFQIAYAEVLETLIENKTSNMPLHKWFFPLVHARAKGYQVQEKDLTQISGNYGVRTIFRKNGKLYYQYSEDPAYEIELLDKNTAIFKAFSEARLEIVFEDNKAVALKMHTFGEAPKQYAKTL